jgi:hypothetical protein
MKGKCSTAGCECEVDVEYSPTWSSLAPEYVGECPEHGTFRWHPESERDTL